MLIQQKIQSKEIKKDRTNLAVLFAWGEEEVTTSAANTCLPRRGRGTALRWIGLITSSEARLCGFSSAEGWFKGVNLAPKEKVVRIC